MLAVQIIIMGSKYGLGQRTFWKSGKVRLRLLLSALRGQWP